MIDINLAERLEKAPEKEKIPRERKPPSRRTMLILSLGAAAILLFFTYQSIIDFIKEYRESNSVQKEFTPVSSTHLETTGAVTQDSLSEDKPVGQTATEDPAPAEPEKDIEWDYSRSMMHIEVYVALTGAIPENFDYELINVSGGTIIAEIIKRGDAPFTQLQAAFRQQLPQCSFTFTQKGDTLEVFGDIESAEGLAGVKPAVKYASPESNIEALSSLKEQHNIESIAEKLTDPVKRNNADVYFVQIDYSGAEDNIIAFLNTLQEEGLSLNILRISGFHVDGAGETSPSVHLVFQFELII